MFWRCKPIGTLSAAFGTISICHISQIITEKASKCGLVLYVATKSRRITREIALIPVKLCSLDYLFGLGALDKNKFLVHICIVRAQVPPSGEETRRQNYIAAINMVLHGAPRKSGTSSGSTSYAMVITNLQPTVNQKFAQFCVTVEKANGSSLLPHLSSRRHGDRTANGWKKGERGHHVTYVISVKKFDDCHLSDYSTCPPSNWGLFSPRPGNIYALRCRQNSSRSKSVPV
ncbi:hypothetical protein TNCV_3554281 [Trichonephila clavipes]|nr:hypothetical protein TNCV_3554281 [Trichonephila clavipes]